MSINKCPECDDEFQKVKISIFGHIGLGCLGEITIWLSVAIITVVLSIPENMEVYLYGVFLVAALVGSVSYFYRLYHCNKCNIKYSAYELRKKYNKRSQLD